jgi:ribose/xylose/arabinose/galactoside ABC-type transport system permease subunit
MQIAILVVLALLGLFFLKRRATARAIYKTGDREVWAQASELRFPRYPRSRPFGKKRGLR